MDARDFLVEFAHIASAPDGIYRLRQMIYNLAITGNLTQQLSGDGDAESIITAAKRIKIQLIHENSYKRSPKLEKTPLSIPEEFNIPDTWRWTRLVDIGEINPKNDAADDTLVSFIPMSDIPQTYLGELKWETRLWGQIRKGYTHFSDGDVVLAKITPSFENGKGAVISGLMNSIGAGSTELHVVRPLNKDILPEYIYIFLRSPYFWIEGSHNMIGTAGQKRLPTVYFATRAFPLPPRKEQKRIVSKVDELMALCDQLEAQQQERETLNLLTRKSIFEELTQARSSLELEVGWTRVHDSLNLWLNDEAAIEEFKNAVSFLGCRGLLLKSMSMNSLEANDFSFPIPKNWEWVFLNELSEYITSGSRGWKKYYAPQGDRFIRSQDIKYNVLLFENPVFVNLPEQVEGMRTLAREGDLLITITGANVGKCARVPEMEFNAYVSQHVALIRLKDARHAPFLHWWITNTFGGQKNLANYIYGDKPGLNLKQVGSILIPLPPQSVQDQIVKTLEHYEIIFDILSKQLKEAQHVAEMLASAAVSSITGISSEGREKMKIPKTELISNLNIGKSPPDANEAPLSSILNRNNGELPAKMLWNASGLEIDAFYQQLRAEMAEGWIVQEETAYVREVETR